MKKLTVIILFLLTLSITAQTAKTPNNLAEFIISKITQSIDGHETSRSPGEVMGVAVKAPSFYDMELIIMKVNGIVSIYTDVHYLENWKLVEPKIYESWIIVGEDNERYLMQLSWFEIDKMLLFIYTISN